MKEKTETNKTRTPNQRATRIVTVVMLVYALTVAVNLGEFWPFSIYPMFSQGGKTWNRSLVRELPAGDADELIQSEEWVPSDLLNLPGNPFSVKAAGVDAIDLANFISKTQLWDSVRVAALERMLFNGANPDRSLLVFKVSGSLNAADGVEISATPFVLITPGKDWVNPGIRP